MLCTSEDTQTIQNHAQSPHRGLGSPHKPAQTKELLNLRFSQFSPQKILPYVLWLGSCNVGQLDPEFWVVKLLMLQLNTKALPSGNMNFNLVFIGGCSMYISCSTDKDYELSYSLKQKILVSNFPSQSYYLRCTCKIPRSLFTTDRNSLTRV